MVLHRPPEPARLTGHLLFGPIHFYGNRVYPAVAQYGDYDDTVALEGLPGLVCYVHTCFQIVD